MHKYVHKNILAHMQIHMKIMRKVNTFFYLDIIGSIDIPMCNESIIAMDRCELLRILFLDLTVRKSALGRHFILIMYYVHKLKIIFDQTVLMYGR